MADALFSEEVSIQKVIDLTREIADALDRRRREPSNIAAAATIATWAMSNDQLCDISEQLEAVGETLMEAFGGDDPDGDYGDDEQEGEEGEDDSSDDEQEGEEGEGDGPVGEADTFDEEPAVDPAPIAQVVITPDPVAPAVA